MLEGFANPLSRQLDSSSIERAHYPLIALPLPCANSYQSWGSEMGADIWQEVNLTFVKLKLRLHTLLDRKRGLQSRATPASKLSSTYITLDEGFRLFSNDLDKLQQFVEVNQTAFSKILKKVLSFPVARVLVQR